MSDNKTVEQIKEEIREEEEKNSLNPLAWLGYIFGGISLLNLVNEFKIIKLYGLVKTWADAFSSFILGIRDYLFGWIKISWIEISDTESYFLVISFLFISSFARAMMIDFSLNPQHYDVRDYDTKALRILSGILLYLIIFLAISLFSLLLPNLVTLPIFSFSVLIVTIYLLFPSSKKNELRAAIKARSNLIGSFVVFLLLVAINYGLQA